MRQIAPKQTVGRAAVVIADPCRFARETLCAALGARGCHCIQTATIDELCGVLSIGLPDLIILDPLFDRGKGLQVLKHLRSNYDTDSVRVVVTTEVAKREVVLAFVKLGIDSYMLKNQFSFNRLASIAGLGAGEAQRLGAPGNARKPGATPRLTITTASERPAPADHNAPASTGSPAPTSPTAHRPADAQTTPMQQPGAVCELPELPEPILLDQDPAEKLKDLKPFIKRSDLDALLEQGEEVSAMSPTVTQVLKLSQSQNCSIDAVVDAIKMDHAIALKILKLANSNVYSRGEPCASIRQAVVRIGLEQIRDAVLNISVIDGFSSEATAAGLDTGQFWEHAIATGLVASQLAAHTRELTPDTAFTLGLLHDVGRAILATSLGHQYLHIVQTSARLDLPLEQVEKRMLLFDHAEAMDRTLRRWQFPKHLINPIVFHHLSAANIRGQAPNELETCVTLAMANRIAHAMLLGTSGNDAIYGSLDLAEAIRLPASLVQTIEKNTRDQTDDLKFTLLQSANTDSNWTERRQSVVSRLPADCHPVAVSTDPDRDTIAMFCRRLVSPHAEAPANLAVVSITDVRSRFSLATALRAADEKAGRRLPAILCSANGKLALDDATMSQRPHAKLRVPFTVERFIKAASALSAEAAQPASAAG
jgi:HD-like signal output (HDOD) protein